MFYRAPASDKLNNLALTLVPSFELAGPKAYLCRGFLFGQAKWEIIFSCLKNGQK